jgi:hypothetical protein
MKKTTNNFSILISESQLKTLITKIKAVTKNN